MRFDKSPDWVVSLFDAAIEGLPLQRRKMFGYPAGFANGQMCCGLFGKQFFLRLGENDRGELLRIEGASEFDPMGGRPMREYVVLPDSIRGAGRASILVNPLYRVYPVPSSQADRR